MENRKIKKNRTSYFLIGSFIVLFLISIGAFTYLGPKSGMLLKQHWVEGTHYWESALRILDKIYPELLEAKLQEWLDSYFGG